MKKTLILIVCTLALFNLRAQTGQPFPALTGETLNEGNKTIPDAVAGKASIIGMAYSAKAEDALRTWFTPVYDKFILKRAMFDFAYDVNVLFVPMYTGLKEAAYEPSMKEMRDSKRTDLYPYMLFYKGNLEPYASVLKMEEKDSPYFFVLDPQGEIVYATRGIFTEEKMEAIEEVLDELE